MLIHKGAAFQVISFIHKLQILIDEKFPCSANPNINQSILNLYSYQLSTLEFSVLFYGSDNGIPPVMKHKEIYSDVEVFFVQFAKLQPNFLIKLVILKSN